MWSVKNTFTVSSACHLFFINRDIIAVVTVDLHLLFFLLGFLFYKNEQMLLRNDSRSGSSPAWKPFPLCALYRCGFYLLPTRASLGDGCLFYLFFAASPLVIVVISFALQLPLLPFGSFQETDDGSLPVQSSGSGYVLV